VQWKDKKKLSIAQNSPPFPPIQVEGFSKFSHQEPIHLFFQIKQNLKNLSLHKVLFFWLQLLTSPGCLLRKFLLLRHPSNNLLQLSGKSHVFLMFGVRQCVPIHELHQNQVQSQYEVENRYSLCK
jgi:hypothetical protein